MNDQQHVFKVIFHNQGKVYEIYAHGVSQSAMIGFIEVEDLIFGKRTSVVVDPAEEKLQSEFAGVTRAYIPLHSVIRIDEVEKEGTNKIHELSENGANVTPFPSPLYTPPKSPE